MTSAHNVGDDRPQRQTNDTAPTSANPSALLVSGYSSRGRVRPSNEDRASIDGMVVAEEASIVLPIGAGDHLFIVADGMGGHARGDLASSLAVEVINSHRDQLVGPAGCIEVLRLANESVYEASKAPGRSGMGTTVVGAIVTDYSICWFNVGDSRVYLFRGGALTQLSIDHVPTDIAVTGRRANVITQSLGGTYHPRDISPAAGLLERLNGDRLLLCTDGITDLLSNDELHSALGAGFRGAETAKSLVEVALERGAPDNATALVASL